MKTLTLKPFALYLAILGVAGTVSAQNDLNLPDVSQAAEVKQRIALTDITVKYHRPLLNGRKIWGGLVPYGKVWRAGANENTTIEFSDSVSVEGKPLVKGTYGLHMIPNPDSWTVIFSDRKSTRLNSSHSSISYAVFCLKKKKKLKKHHLQNKLSIMSRRIIITHQIQNNSCNSI